MAKDPAVLFYTSDFLSGTAFFNDEQRGQYIKLLCEQHQNGHIPDAHMIKICKSYDSPVFKKFEKDSKGLYFNKRMEREIQRRISYSESRKKNRLGSGKEEENVSHDITHDITHDVGMTTHMETENEDINNKKKGVNFEKPKIEEVKAYCKERRNDVDFNKWFDFYEAKGWMIGKNKMKDWKAAIRTWEKTESKIVVTQTTMKDDIR